MAADKRDKRNVRERCSSRKRREGEKIIESVEIIEDHNTT